MGPGARLGRYVLGDELGEGGMATVYRARDLELRREVAIKVLFPHLARRAEVVARFQREGRAAASLDHPHILKVFDVGGAGEGEPPYLVLELVPGTSLAEIETPLLAEVAAAIGAALCEALAEAHDAGIVHRDVKPANVLVGEGGRVVLGDFGVARVTDEDSLVTRTGAVLGTPAYMAPEQALGEGLGARSDLYSVGATLYALATGSAPFAGNAARVVSDIAAGRLVPPARRNPAIGPELAAVVERLMALEPALRPADARAAAAALDEVWQAAGFRDRAALLARGLGDGELTELRQEIVVATMERARAAAGAGELPRAMALCDRVLALDPDRAEALALVESLGQRRSRRRWLGLAAVASAGLASAWALWPASGPAQVAARPGAVAAPADAAPADAAPAALAATVASPPPQAGDAASDASASPVVRRHRPAARRPVALRAADAAPAPPLAEAAPAPADAAPPRRASITVEVRPWCDVTIDGIPHGRADPRRPIELDPGRHQVVCAQPGTGARWEQVVDLEPGAHRRLRGTVLADIEIEVDVARGDAVRIAGHGVHARGARLQLPPGRLRVQVLAGGAPAGDHTYITVRHDCVLRDRPRLGCYRAGER